MSKGRCWLLALLAIGSQITWVPFAPTQLSKSRRKGLLSALGHLTVGASAEPAFDWGQATLVLVLCSALALPARALAPTAEYPDGNPVASDLRLPALPQEEQQRRRTTPREQLKVEQWYKQGKRAFETNCSGCHPISRFVNERNQDQLMTKEYFEKRGGIDESRIQYNIRYGAGNMPGYAADCGDLNDNFAATCSTVVPLSEEKLRDVQDYLLNRVNTDNWQTPP
ncbi:unnamed protein product [Durusdinium trenchii]